MLTSTHTVVNRMPPIYSRAGMITGAQIRAGRSLVNLTADQLAQLSGVSVATIMRAEKALGVPRTLGTNLAKIQAALEAAGVVFVATNSTAGAGVRLRRGRD